MSTFAGNTRCVFGVSIKQHWKMDDENRIRLKTALRLISASNEDIFFNSDTLVDDSSTGDGAEVKDPFDDDVNSLDEPSETYQPNQIFGKVITVLRDVNDWSIHFRFSAATKSIGRGDRIDGPIHFWPSKGGSGNTVRVERR